MKSLACAFLCLLSFSTVFAAIARSGEPALYDTVAPIDQPIAAEALRARGGWKRADGLASLAGDGVIENARIALVLERASGRAILFYKLGGEVRECARVAGTSAASGDSFSSILTEPAGAGEAVLIAKGTTGEGKAMSMRCRVVGDQPIVEFRPLADLDAFSLLHRSTHAVLPEIFGDDLVLRAGETETSPLRLPAEHAVLHTLDGGDALLLVTWPPGSKEIPVHAGKVDEKPSFLRTDVSCTAPGEKIWLSVLAGRGIWHEADAARFTISQYRMLDWKPPFPARYRADLRRDDGWGLTDSWSRQPSRDKFWMPFLSNGFAPLSISDGEASFRIPRFRPGLPFPKNLPPELKYSGPILIYPFRRETDEKVGKTPEGEWTVLDVVRTVLGEGWPRTLDIGEGILEVAPYPKGFVFVATCGATGQVEEIFTRRKEKEEAAAVRHAFDEMMQFVRYNRARIEEYAAFGVASRKILEDFEKTHAPGPELGLADLVPLLAYLPDLLEQSRDTIRTPDYCKGLTEKVIALIDGRGPERLKQVKELGVAIRTIGGRQDDMLCGHRLALKAFRQRAGQLHAVARDPSVRALLRRIRGESRALLRVCSPYEEYLFISASRVALKQ